MRPKLKYYEEQGILEIRYSIGNIGSYSSTNCYQHHLVHGVWTPRHLKRCK